MAQLIAMLSALILAKSSLRYRGGATNHHRLSNIVTLDSLSLGPLVKAARIAGSRWTLGAVRPGIGATQRDFYPDPLRSDF